MGAYADVIGKIEDVTPAAVALMNATSWGMLAAVAAGHGIFDLRREAPDSDDRDLAARTIERALGILQAESIDQMRAVGLAPGASFMRALVGRLSTLPPFEFVEEIGRGFSAADGLDVTTDHAIEAGLKDDDANREAVALAKSGVGRDMLRATILAARIAKRRLAGDDSVYPFGDYADVLP